MPNVITDLLGKATVINLMYLWVVFFFFSKAFSSVLHRKVLVMVEKVGFSIAMLTTIY